MLASSIFGGNSMLRKIISLFMLFLLIPISQASQIAGEYLVKLKTQSSLNEFNNRKDFKVIDVLGNKLVHIRLNEQKNSNRILEGLRQDPYIELIEPNYLYQLASNPNDPYFPKLWGLHNTGQHVGAWDGKAGVDINILKAWEIEKGSKDIIVAVLDTGLDMNYQEMRKNLWVNQKEFHGKPGVDDDQNGYIDDIHGYNFQAKSGQLTDDEGHGTHVAGTIGAATNDGIGISGVIQNVSIMPLRIFGNHEATLACAIKAIDYAISNDARVMNNSWGGARRSELLYEAIQRANQKEILFVAAAGNNFSNNDPYEEHFYPANYELPNVVSVAAINNRGELARFSNYGQTVHVGAPGKNIYSYMSEHYTEMGYEPAGYYSLDGTSMSAPHVSGVAALMLSKKSEIQAKEIKSILIHTSKKLEGVGGKIFSGGIIDAYQALLSL